MRVKGRKRAGPDVSALTLPQVELRKSLSHSSKNTFHDCNRRYYYEYAMGLDSRGLKMPLVVGTAVHEEIDKMYQNLGNYGEAGIEDSWINITKYFDEIRSGNHPEHQPMSQRDFDELAKGEAQAKGAIAAYVRKYEHEDATKIEVIEPEHVFKNPIEHTDGWRESGKIDLTYRRRDTGRYGVMEHKTASRIDHNYVAKIDMDRQTLRYARAGRDTLKLPIEEITYNVIGKTAIRQRKNETPHQFLMRIIEDEYEAQPEKYFYRTRFDVPPAADLIPVDDYLLIQRIEQCNESGIWFQNTNHCYAYNSVCPFMRLCVEGIDEFNILDYDRKAGKRDNPAAKEV